MGQEACHIALHFLLQAGVKTILDPFCGQGTALAAANSVGIDAIGVDIGNRRCRKARELELSLAACGSRPWKDVSQLWDGADANQVLEVFDRVRRS